MKKHFLTIAMVLGLSMSLFAGNEGGGLFGLGATPEETRGNHGLRENDELSLGLPGHGKPTDQDAPLGSGVCLLLGLGAAYAFTKKKES